MIELAVTKDQFYQALSWGMIEADVMTWTVELWPLNFNYGNDCRRPMAIYREN